jgi:hypothetical protein
MTDSGNQAAYYKSDRLQLTLTCGGGSVMHVGLCVHGGTLSTERATVTGCNYYNLELLCIRSVRAELICI